jgi:hypothetical protein
MKNDSPFRIHQIRYNHIKHPLILVFKYNIRVSFSLFGLGIDDFKIIRVDQIQFIIIPLHLWIVLLLIDHDIDKFLINLTHAIHPSDLDRFVFVEKGNVAPLADDEIQYIAAFHLYALFLQFVSNPHNADLALC